MGSKYTSQAASGYNASPPSDDGTASESNKVKWSTIKTKLSDVVKTLAEGINTALVTALDHSARSVTASDTAAASDNERTIEVKTSSVNITLSDASTMAAGYMVSVANQSTGPISVSLATNTNTIDMVTNATHSIQAYETRRYIVNAAANGYITASNDAKGWVKIGSQSASASATVDFTSGFSSLFDMYVITLTDIIPATDNVSLNMRISQSSTFRSGAADYAYAQGGFTASGATVNNGSTSGSAVFIASGISNASTSRNFAGAVEIYNPAGTSLTKVINYRAGYSLIGGGYASVLGHGQYTGGTSGSATSAIDGIRFLMSAGNITSGVFTLYGVRKS